MLEAFSSYLLLTLLEVSTVWDAKRILEVLTGPFYFYKIPSSFTKCF